jgi:hypothetical protein
VWDKIWDATAGNGAVWPRWDYPHFDETSTEDSENSEGIQQIQSLLNLEKSLDDQFQEHRAAQADLPLKEHALAEAEVSY